MTPWLRVWTRAVVGPGWKRAVALWVGSAIVGAVIFGPTGMQPRDLTGLALHIPGVAAVLGVTWLLLFVPTARLLVRGEAAAFLRSLPGPRMAPRVITVLALVGLQLPWLVLWGIGAHGLGLAIVAGWTTVIGLVAMLRLPPIAHRAPVWSGSLTALLGIYRRALGRRATDALVRGAGLAPGHARLAGPDHAELTWLAWWAHAARRHLGSMNSVAIIAGALLALYGLVLALPVRRLP